MPAATIVVPAYNVAETIGDTLNSLCRQSFEDFEIVVVDDGSTDQTAEVVRAVADPRIRLVQQSNRGLAGARNTGIFHARGRYVGFCDADDLWRPAKLGTHVAHLDARPDVGISFSGSELIDAEGRPNGLAQTPRLRGIDAAHVFMRNPVGNGSAPVIRRDALDSIAWRPAHETCRDWWFDESFRQSEDIECWLRIALTTDWIIEGVPGLLTRYRIVPGGLSAGTEKQFASWERMVTKLTALAPEFMQRHAPAARAYQQRYLARRAVTSGNGREALRRAMAGHRASLRPMMEEPVKTGVTLAAALVLAGFGWSPLKHSAPSPAGG
ncbi:glycosyltransferase [Sulfitobacter sp. D35]|uniref:glycosyltransferase family 2 protein n=1 Tax=Sulfitobacter sp. D35 TaxID=3083252 RepID=UPI00296ED172|nr:glycosyltransferase [Sulfitobacter sp. D35]MDW4498537.1 glycosyltransferase [Sulfitobacter sp. D35]